MNNIKIENVFGQSIEILTDVAEAYKQANFSITREYIEYLLLSENISKENIVSISNLSDKVNSLCMESLQAQTNVHNLLSEEVK